MNCLRRLTLLVCAAVLVTASVAVAQQGPPPNRLPLDERVGLPPELPMSELDVSKLTPEERKRLERMQERKLPEDATFSDFLALWLEPQPYPKDVILRIDENHAYPHPAASWKMVIVKEDEDTVWLRGLEPENPESPIHRLWNDWQIGELLYLEQQKRKDHLYFVDFEAPLVPPPSVDALAFRAAEEPLPSKGRWQMNFVLADMDGDGLDDLVFPPSRKGTPYPLIFRGQEDGGFAVWQGTYWSDDVPFDYGGVAAADFDGDGHQDVAIAIHFKGQYVLYGDGEGSFARHDLLPSPDPRLTSRAVESADFDGDGRMDLALLAEINYDQSRSTKIEGASTTWVLLNRGQGRWEVVTDGLAKNVIGDRLDAADVDGDGRPDLVFSSNYADWRRLVYLNDAEKGWTETGVDGVLSNAYHFDVQAVPAADGADVVAVFEQFRMVRGENQARTGVVVYPWREDGLSTHGSVVDMDAQRSDPYFRLGTGDLDGNGLTDIVAGRKGGELRVYLQTAPGTYYLERSERLDSAGRPYDIHLRDLNGDGRDDLLISFAIRDDLPGGVRVYMTGEAR